MVLFIKQGVEPAAVANALPTIFAVGGNLAIPKTLPEPPQEWRVPYDEMARENKLDSTFDDACRIVAQFFDDVARIIATT